MARISEGSDIRNKPDMVHIGCEGGAEGCVHTPTHAFQKGFRGVVWGSIWARFRAPRKSMQTLQSRQSLQATRGSERVACPGHTCILEGFQRGCLG